jgi:hypothetical protein
MYYVAYLTERALEFRNLALTRDAEACGALHHLADLCSAKAAALAGARNVTRDVRPATKLCLDG